MSRFSKTLFSFCLIICSALALVSCANKDVYRGDVYRGGEAKAARQLSYGTLLDVREVLIQAEDSGGAVLGTGVGGGVGYAAGRSIGKGHGQTAATVVATAAGAIIGNKIQQKSNLTKAQELSIEKDDGSTFVIVQKYDKKLSQPGIRIRIVGSGNSLSVSAL